MARPTATSPGASPPEAVWGPAPALGVILSPLGVHGSRWGISCELHQTILKVLEKTRLKTKRAGHDPPCPIAPRFSGDMGRGPQPLSGEGSALGGCQGWAFLLFLLFLPGLTQAQGRRSHGRGCLGHGGRFWGAGARPWYLGEGNRAALSPPTPFWARAAIPAPDPIMAMRSDILLRSLGGRRRGGIMKSEG